MSGAYVITILVTSGDPDGVRVVEKSNWTGRGVVFGRPDLRTAIDVGLGSPGVYVLLGDDPQEQYDMQIYVGQAEDIGRRLSQHEGDDTKNFWAKTIAFLSGNESLHRAHIGFLEAELIRLANKANRVKRANGTVPSSPHLPGADRAIAEGFLNEMLAIFPVLGVNAFEPVNARADSGNGSDRYTMDASGGRGEGEERSDGFLVFKGAVARLDETPSLATGRSNRLRQRLIDSGILARQNDHYILTEDYLFTTPSAAAMTLQGGHVNGRKAWRDSDGVSLRDRQIARAKHNPT